MRPYDGIVMNDAERAEAARELFRSAPKTEQIMKEREALAALVRARKLQEAAPEGVTPCPICGHSGPQIIEHPGCWPQCGGCGTV